LKIISGAQTGVDTAALKMAIAKGLPYCGWVPKGRTNEDGLISSEFKNLQESSSLDSNVRTRLNVEAAEAVLAVIKGDCSPGTSCAIDTAKEYGISILIIDLAVTPSEKAIECIRNFIEENKPAALNIVGPRESEATGICEQAYDILEKAF
jgi:hypothetical protein